MAAIITIRDKTTGKQIEEIEVEAREHGTNCQAMIGWRSITTIEYGDSLSEAIQNAYEKFSRLPPLIQFETTLIHGR